MIAGGPRAGPRDDRGKAALVGLDGAAARARPGGLSDRHRPGRPGGAGSARLVAAIARRAPAGGPAPARRARTRRLVECWRSAAWGRARRSPWSRTWRRARPARRSRGRTAGPAGRRVRAAAEDGLAGPRGPGDRGAGPLAAARRWDAMGLWLSGEAVPRSRAHESAPCRGRACGRRRAGRSHRAGARPFGSRLGSLRAGAAEALGLRAGHPGGRRRQRRRGVHAGRRAASPRRRRGHGRDVRRDRDLRGPAGDAWAGSFLSPAPLPGRWVVGGAMAALGRPSTGCGPSVLGRPLVAGRPVPGRVAGPGGRGRAGVPAVPRGRARPDLRRGGARAFVRPDAGARARAPGPRRAGGGRVRDAPRGGAARGRRGPAPRAAPCRSSEPGDVWARIKADVLGVPVAIPAVGESAVLGAAILAAAGVGARGDLEAGRGVDDLRGASARAGPGGARAATTRRSASTSPSTRRSAPCSITGPAARSSGAARRAAPPSSITGNGASLRRLASVATVHVARASTGAYAVRRPPCHSRGPAEEEGSGDDD